MVRVIKYLHHGNGRQPVMFVRAETLLGTKVGYVWGYRKRDAEKVPLTDTSSDERGVTWHPNLLTAMVAWAKDRETRRTPEGGYRQCPKKCAD